jgi:glucose-6-phosphate 1-epimerase
MLFQRHSSWVIVCEDVGSAMSDLTSDVFFVSTHACNKNRDCMTTQTLALQALNNEHAIGDLLEFVAHPKGLIVGKVHTDHCHAMFYLQGAQVAEFHPRHAIRPVLFTSSQATVAAGRALRGGMPICFPWFGSQPNAPDQPAHGWARTQSWTVRQTEVYSGDVEVVLGLDVFPYAIEQRFLFGKELAASFSAKNVSDATQSFEIALHTYFSIGSIRSVIVEGDLSALPYLDQLTSVTHPATHRPIRFTEETDRIYQGEAREIRIQDMSWNRTLHIRSENSRSTVVWNPWIAKSQRMADFGDDEYLRMCCIETANVREHALQLVAGQTHTTRVVIGVEQGGIEPTR